MDVVEHTARTSGDPGRGGTTTSVAHRRVDSPVGELVLVGDDDTVVGLHLPAGKPPDPAAIGDEDPDLLPDVAAQLAQYFAGERTVFDVPLDPRGTDFQRRVWTRLQAIPHGRTCSYGDIARDVGGPRTTRAVGLANGANPIPIIIPCHRVIGADGSLVGFGGGLPAKRFLLDLEAGATTLFDAPVPTTTTTTTTTTTADSV